MYALGWHGIEASCRPSKQLPNALRATIDVAAAADQ
jgi:hypothetical protein